MLFRMVFYLATIYSFYDAYTQPHYYVHSSIEHSIANKLLVGGLLPLGWLAHNYI